jgi:hypothetical protein
MEEYVPKDIKNGDKMRFFFCAFPSKILCLEGKRWMGGKHSNERLTLFLWFYDWGDWKTCGYTEGHKTTLF